MLAALKVKRGYRCKESGRHSVGMRLSDTVRCRGGLVYDVAEVISW